jgi:hypothetical protein
VHDGVEVQVQRLAVGQPGRDGGLVQGGQERGLPGALQPVAALPDEVLHNQAEF